MDSVALGAYIDSRGYSTLGFNDEGVIIESKLTVEEFKKMGDLQSVKMSCASLLCESEDQDIFELHKRILASKYLNIVCISRINRLSLTQQSEMFKVILGNSNITELSLVTDDGTALSGQAEAFVTKMINADRIASLYLCGDISFELQRESLKLINMKNFREFVFQPSTSYPHTDLLEAAFELLHQKTTTPRWMQRFVLDFDEENMGVVSEYMQHKHHKRFVRETSKIDLCIVPHRYDPEKMVEVRTCLLDDNDPFTVELLLSSGDASVLEEFAAYREFRAQHIRALGDMVDDLHSDSSEE
uniref:FTH domain-containing protein n=1 Tax=Steinernema glaseri TaxID=37863 RepID=A0A1I7YGY4_9BILA